MKFVAIILLAGLGALVAAYCRAWGMSANDAAQIFTRRTCPAVLESFRRDVGRYPFAKEGLAALLHAPAHDAKGWNGPYFDGRTIPRDPWGREYRYRVTSRSHEIYSLGPDGLISGDDISFVTSHH